MKFNQRLLNSITPEWKEAYVNYNMLKIFLKPFKKYRQAQKFRQSSPRRKLSMPRRSSSIFSLNLDLEHLNSDDLGAELEALEGFSNKFERQLDNEFQKFSLFF